MRDKATRVRVRVALGSAGHTEIASVLQCQRIAGKQHKLVCALVGKRVENTRLPELNPHRKLVLFCWMYIDNKSQN